MTIRSITNYITMALALAGCVVAIVLTWEEYHPKADIGCSKFGGDCSKTIQSSYGHLGPIPTSLFGLAMYLTVTGLCVVRARAIRASTPQWNDRAFRSSPVVPETAGRSEPAPGDGAAGPGDTPGAEALAAAETELSAAAPIASTAPVEETTSEERTPEIGDRRLDIALFAIALPAIAISWWLQYAALWVICSFCPWCLGSASIATLIFLMSTLDLFVIGRKLDGEQRLLAGVASFIIVCFAFVGTPLLMERAKICGAAKPGGGGPPPEIPVDKRAMLLGTAPTHRLDFRGDPKSKYTLIEFGDYQCSHCRKAIPIVEGLLKAPPEGGLRLAFRNFPLPNHVWAMQCALAAEAAGNQGKFWKMHDLIYSQQAELDKQTFGPEQIDKWAASLGLDMKKFSTDYESTAILDRIKDDQNAADETRLMITPTFYLITPTRITQFAGTEVLENVIRDRKNVAWK